MDQQPPQTPTQAGEHGRTSALGETVGGALLHSVSACGVQLRASVRRESSSPVSVSPVSVSPVSVSPESVSPESVGGVVGSRIRAVAFCMAALATVAAACSGDASTDAVGGTDSSPGAVDEGSAAAAPETGPAAGESASLDAGDDDDGLGGTVTLLTHDSFALSSETLEAFTASTGVEVEHLASGDAGALVAQACLTAGEPLGDVLFGIDNTFLQRGLDCGVFEPYESPGLAGVPDRFELDALHRVTPVDFGDVCLNYWIDAFDGSPPAPSSLDDLTDPAYAGMLVVQSPETSSPGLAFLLATVARYGDGSAPGPPQWSSPREDVVERYGAGWEGYWAHLRANGVSVAAGWEDAYYGEFAAGGGDRPIVVSYASSPPAEVIFADPPVDEPPTGVVTASCYRQIEFAGVLAGAGNPDGARALIDFMLTDTFQNDVPLNMFVFPVVSGATLPPEFEAHAETADDPFMVDPAEVEAQRDAWTDRWVEIVLR